jgi:hypothetical protein
MTDLRLKSPPPLDPQLVLAKWVKVVKSLFLLAHVKTPTSTPTYPQMKSKSLFLFTPLDPHFTPSYPRIYNLLYIRRCSGSPLVARLAPSASWRVLAKSEGIFSA